MTTKRADTKLMLFWLWMSGVVVGLVLAGGGR